MTALLFLLFSFQARGSTECAESMSDCEKVLALREEAKPREAIQALLETPGSLYESLRSIGLSGFFSALKSKSRPQLTEKLDRALFRPLLVSRTVTNCGLYLDAEPAGLERNCLEDVAIVMESWRQSLLANWSDHFESLLRESETRIPSNVEILIHIYQRAVGREVNLLEKSWKGAPTNEVEQKFITTQGEEFMRRLGYLTMAFGVSPSQALTVAMRVSSSQKVVTTKSLAQTAEAESSLAHDLNEDNHQITECEPSACQVSLIDRVAYSFLERSESEIAAHINLLKTQWTDLDWLSAQMKCEVRLLHVLVNDFNVERTFLPASCTEAARFGQCVSELAFLVSSRWPINEVIGNEVLSEHQQRVHQIVKGAGRSAFIHQLSLILPKGNRLLTMDDLIKGFEDVETNDSEERPTKRSREVLQFETVNDPEIFQRSTEFFHRLSVNWPDWVFVQFASEPDSKQHMNLWLRAIFDSTELLFIRTLNPKTWNFLGKISKFAYSISGESPHFNFEKLVLVDLLFRDGSPVHSPESDRVRLYQESCEFFNSGFSQLSFAGRPFDFARAAYFLSGNQSPSVITAIRYRGWGRAGIQRFKSILIGAKVKVTMFVERSDLLETSIPAFPEFFAPGSKEFSYIVNFMDEMGVDQGGPKREWIWLIANNLFSKEFGMFEIDKLGRLVPTRSALYAENPYSSNLLRVCGILLRLAINSNVSLGITFPKPVYMSLLNIPVDNQMILESDPSLKLLVQKITETVPDEDGMLVPSPDAVVYIEAVDLSERKVLDFGQQRGRRCMAISQLESESDMSSYVQFLIDEARPRLCGIEAFIKGFRSIDPKLEPTLAEVERIEQLLQGSSILDVTAWREMTDTPREVRPVIGHFWEAVAELNANERSNLLTFWTACPRLPPGGFAALRPKLKISYALSTAQYLVSHTCFFSLDVPSVNSTEAIVKIIKDTLLQGVTGFGIA